MQIALLHDQYNEAHIEVVKSEMQVLGAPRIKAVWIECYCVWAALEGCHRIRAAEELGLVPEIDEIEYSEETTTEDLGLGDSFDGDVWTVAELADEAHRRHIIDFAD